MALPQLAGGSVSPRPDHGTIILRNTVQHSPDPLRVVLLADDREGTADSVERLMGSKAEARFAFISDKAEFASEDLLDV
jgi:hypothetical protein